MDTAVVPVEPPRKKALVFLRHFFDMVVVMMVGMVALGAAFGAFHRVVFGAGFASAWRDHVGLAAVAMAFNMTVPMVLWMRYRGHGRQRAGEMALAMNLPLLPAFVLYAFDAIPARGVLGMQMMLMIPAMLAVMVYRKEEYGASPAAHGDRKRRLARVPHVTRNMGALDRSLRAFVVAPTTIVLALLLGAGAIVGVVLVAAAGVMLVTATTGFCPTYTLVGIATGPSGIHRTARGLFHGHA